MVKLYILEPESDVVISAIQNAKRVAVSHLAMPEVVSVFARCVQEKLMSRAEAQSAFSQLLQDWEKLDRYSLENHVAKEAGSLALSRDLRGADAVQLATVAILSREKRGVRFLAFDQKLKAAGLGIVRLYGE